MQLLIQALSTQQTPRYTIDSLAFYHVQPLAKQCLQSLLPTMNQLRRLELVYAPAGILLHTLQAVPAAPITTLEEVNLNFSDFSSRTVHELCTALVSNCQCISEVWLQVCHVGTEGALCLSHELNKLYKLTGLHLESNNISETGAQAVITAVLGLRRVKVVNLLDNSISSKGKKKLYKFKAENKAEWLYI